MTTVRFNNGRYEVWDDMTDGYWEASKEEALKHLSNADKLVFNTWQNHTLETINKFRDISSMLPVPFLELKAPRCVGKTTLIKALTVSNRNHLVIGIGTPKDGIYTNYINGYSLNRSVLTQFRHVEEIWLDDVELTLSQLNLIRLIIKPKSIIQIYTPK